MKSANRSVCLTDISNFSTSESFETNFTQLKQVDFPVFYSDKRLHSIEKRTRGSPFSVEVKKSLHYQSPVSKLVTQLHDPDTDSDVNFNCFYEKDVICDDKVSSNLVDNDCDDDCPTDTLQIDLIKSSLLKDLEDTLIGFAISK